MYQEAGALAGGALGMAAPVLDLLSEPRKQLWRMLGLPDSGGQLASDLTGLDQSHPLSQALGLGAEVALDPVTWLSGPLGALAGSTLGGAADLARAGKVAGLRGEAAGLAGGAAAGGAANDLELIDRLSRAAGEAQTPLSGLRDFMGVRESPLPTGVVPGYGKKHLWSGMQAEQPGTGELFGTDARSFLDRFRGDHPGLSRADLGSARDAQFAANASANAGRYHAALDTPDAAEALRRLLANPGLQSGPAPIASVLGAGAKADVGGQLAASPRLAGLDLLNAHPSAALADLAGAGADAAGQVGRLGAMSTHRSALADALEGSGIDPVALMMMTAIPTGAIGGATYSRLTRGQNGPAEPVR